MRGTWIVFRREVAQYFTSPFAYFIASAFLFLTGFLFTNDLNVSVGVKAAQPALVPAFLAFALIFFAPLLTMRMLAEEEREGTMELLLTAPVKDSDIVFGKFLGAWFYLSVLLGLSLLYQVILLILDTRPDLSHTASAYIGIWLYGGATMAVGLLFSSLTENQVVAAFLATATLLMLWLGDLAGQIISNIDAARIVRQLTLQGHFSTSFAVGLIRAEDVAFFAGMIVIVLFITVRIVESHRWR